MSALVRILFVLLLAINSPALAARQPPGTVTTATGVEMVLIPAGSFIMGDDNGQDDEKPQHQVFISAFYMDKYEVTQLDYLRITGTNPSKFGGKDWKLYPTDRVGWQQAAAYCNERSNRQGLEPCYDEETWQCNFDADGYRLPTEAEWEYAYRAGTGGSYYFGNSGSNGPAQHAWFKENSGNQTHPVGSKRPNRWKLHDMAGNVYEWCNDYYDPNYYRHSRSKDPRGPQTGEHRVLRGGCWVTSLQSCRAASRFSDEPVNADTCLGYPAYGFRCVRRPNDRVTSPVGPADTAENRNNQ